MDKEKVEALVKDVLPNARKFRIRLSEIFRQDGWRVDVEFDPYYEDVEIAGQSYRVFYPDLDNDMGGALSGDKTLRISFEIIDGKEINILDTLLKNTTCIKADGIMRSGDGTDINLAEIPSIKGHAAYLTLC